MWHRTDDDLRLDLNKISTSEFKIVKDDDSLLTLVCPKKNKWDWVPEERWLRSVMVNHKGIVVSCSFPKFGNYGEFQEDTEILNRALSEGRVLFTHKEDGTLCIRSVIDGKVVMRTRGTLFGESSMDDRGPTFSERFRAVAEKKYPKLLDPTCWRMDSLLFEYVAPDNTIVVRYGEPDLVLVGAVLTYPKNMIPDSYEMKHPTPKLADWSYLEMAAKSGGLNLVRREELPRNPAELMSEVRDWKTEGVVTRCFDERGNTILVKVKSAWYLAHHRLKSNMKYSTITEFAEMSNIGSEDDLAEYLKKCDYDWEIIESAKELYARYTAAVEDARAWMCEAGKKAGEASADVMFAAVARKKDPPLPGTKEHRKGFAAIAVRQHSVIKTMMFLIYDSKWDRLKALVRKLVRDERRRDD